MEESTARTVVKVFAVLGWIVAAFAILAGLSLTVFAQFAGSFLAAMTSSLPLGAIAPTFGAGLIWIAAFVCIILGVFAIFVGLGLWKLQPWARIAMIVFGVLGLLNILSFAIIPAAIGALELWLFGFDKTVKSLFTPAPVVTV